MRGLWQMVALFPFVQLGLLPPPQVKELERLIWAKWEGTRRLKWNKCVLSVPWTPQLPVNEGNWGRWWGVSWYQNGSSLTGSPRFPRSLEFLLWGPGIGLAMVWILEHWDGWPHSLRRSSITEPCCAMKWEICCSQIPAPKQVRWACSTLSQNKCVQLASTQWRPSHSL